MSIQKLTRDGHFFWQRVVFPHFLPREVELLAYLTDTTWACVRDQHGKIGLLPTSSLVDSWNERTEPNQLVLGAWKMRHKCQHDYTITTFYNICKYTVYIHIYIYMLSVPPRTPKHRFEICRETADGLFNSLVFWVFATFCPTKGLPQRNKNKTLKTYFIRY